MNIMYVMIMLFHKVYCSEFERYVIIYWVTAFHQALLPIIWGHFGHIYFISI